METSKKTLGFVIFAELRLSLSLSKTASRATWSVGEGEIHYIVVFHWQYLQRGESWPLGLDTCPYIQIKKGGLLQQLWSTFFF